MRDNSRIDSKEILFYQGKQQAEHIRIYSLGLYYENHSIYIYVPSSVSLIRLSGANIVLLSSTPLFHLAQ